MSWQLIAVTICTLGGVASVLASIILEVRIFCRPVDVSEHVRTVFFPREENRDGRRDRWTQRLKIRRVTRVKSDANSSKSKKAEVEDIIHFFLEVDRKRMRRSKIIIPVSPKHALNSFPVKVPSSCGETTEFSLWKFLRPEETIEEDNSSVELMAKPSAGELSRIKRRILKVLLESGPPKSLYPISESGNDEVYSESTPLVQGFGTKKNEFGSKAPKNMSDGLDLESGTLFDAVHIDLDAIMAIRGAPVSRELLWKSLAFLGELESHC